MTRAKAFALASQSVALHKTGGSKYQVTHPAYPLRPQGRQGRQMFTFHAAASAYRASTVAVHALALLGTPYDTAELAVYEASVKTEPRFNARELFTVALAWLREEDRKRRAK